MLIVALGIRLCAFATHTYIAFPDETFQYLEPAQRLAFGSGVVTWEYIDGIRSWLLPGGIAAILRAVALLDPDPRTGIAVLRILCILASLAIPYAGYRIAERSAGRGAALAVGVLCALSPQAIYYAPVIMTDGLATDAAMLAIAFAHRPARAGLLFGLACALRYQYAPILAVVALWQYAPTPRALGTVVLAGLAVVVPTLGLLDLLTWGAPFQSVWLNYLRNGPQGFSQAMGAEHWSYYLQYFLVAWGAATPVAVGLAILGARLVPAVALTVALTIGLHMLPAHKELRFILLANVALPVPIGVGIAILVERYAPSRAAWPIPTVLALVLALTLGWGTLSRATAADDWHRDASMLAATATARSFEGACGLAIRSIWVYRTGGYTYWRRDLPIYFETWDRAQTIPGSPIVLPLESMLLGRSVPQYPGPALAEHTDAFNVLMGSPADGLPGFVRHRCHGTGHLDDPTVCVFVRPGGCAG